MAEAKMVMPLPADWLVLEMQRDSLRDALVMLLDTREREASAAISYQNATENFSDSADERRAHERAMLAASAAERGARMLLLTLRGGPMNRPITPVGWSDTDWIKHLAAADAYEAEYNAALQSRCRVIEVNDCLL